MPLCDCLECARLKTEVEWGPHTDPPLGYCWAKNVYIWKVPKPCTKFEKVMKLDYVQASSDSTGDTPK